MCTVMLRLDPGARWPLLLAAVRDEMIGRPWDWPAEHWPEAAPGLIGGRDRLAGGTWLAVRGGAAVEGSFGSVVCEGAPVTEGVLPGEGLAATEGVPATEAVPAVAAVLNGSPVHRIDPGPPGGPPSSIRPSRGRLPLLALRSGVPDADELRAYEVVHLVVADGRGARLVSWDGRAVTDVEIPPGDHIITNEGLDVAADPLVPHFAPLLAAARAPGAEGRGAGASAVPGVSTARWWGDWAELMRGDGLAADDPRALLVRHEVGEGLLFGSSSATLLALGRRPGEVRMDFTATPSDPNWNRLRG